LNNFIEELEIQNRFHPKNNKYRESNKELQRKRGRGGGRGGRRGGGTKTK
jgi:hypothetical protein